MKRLIGPISLPVPAVDPSVLVISLTLQSCVRHSLLHVRIQEGLGHVEEVGYALLRCPDEHSVTQVENVASPAGLCDNLAHVLADGSLGDRNQGEECVMRGTRGPGLGLVTHTLTHMR